jgi:hypothetical protein
MTKVNTNVARDPLAAAVITKVITPAASQGRGSRPDGGSTPLRTELSSITSSRIRATRNAERLYAALPDMETIVTIATSSILSTKDLVNATLIYECDEDDIPMNFRAALNEVTRIYFNEKRTLPKKAYRWVHEAMKWKGANPVLILSDSGFDDTFSLRKVAGESSRSDALRDAMTAVIQAANKQKGRLASIEKKAESDDLFTRQMAAFESMVGTSGRINTEGPQTLSIKLAEGLGKELDEMEEYFKDKQVPIKFHEQLRETFNISLTDNEGLLGIPKMSRRLATEAAGGGVEFGVFKDGTYEGGGADPAPNGVKPENVNLGRDRLKLTDLAPGKGNSPVETKPYAEMPRLEMGQKNRLDYSEIVLPASSTIPVVMNGNSRDPIGWLTLVDDMGNFVSEKSSMYGDINFYNYLNDSSQADNAIGRAYIGLGNSSMAPDIANRISNRFGELAEDYFTDAMARAMGGVELDVNLTETFVKVLLARHMAKRHTQVLYIPAENLAYFATHYDNDGFGISLPERSFVISTVRMSLLFAYMNASVLNASRFMQYDIELSPDDMNGQETADRMKSEIMNTYARRQPTWGNMDDAWAMASNANIAFNIIGNQHYSSHKVSVSDTTPEYKTPDMDFDNELLRRTARLAWVDPDLVMNPENIEFASQIFSKSLIMTSQIQAAQEELSVPLTQYVKAGIKASPTLQADMLKACVEIGGLDTNDGTNNAKLAKYAQYINLYSQTVKVVIPPPDTSAAASQMELFDKRIEFIDKIVDTILNDAIVNQLSDSGLKFQGDDLKQMMRGYYITQWMSGQGMETDLIDMLTDPKKANEIAIAVSNQARDVFGVMVAAGKKMESKIEAERNRRDLEGGGDTDMGGDTGTDATDPMALDDGGTGLDDGLGEDDLDLDDGTSKDEKSPDDDAETDPLADDALGDDKVEGDDGAADVDADASGAGQGVDTELDPDGDLKGV